MNNTANYILLYAGYCIGIDYLDRNTEVLQKQTGFFSKAEQFPYIDAWTFTHIAWGVIAKRMNLSLPIYTGLSVLNEIVLEQLVCKYAEKNPLIHFSKSCDSVPHMAADVVYGLAGYLLTPKNTEAFKSSGVVPKLMWDEGYLTDGHDIDCENPPSKITKWNRRNRHEKKGNRWFGFTTKFDDAIRPFRKGYRHQQGSRSFYIFKIGQKPYDKKWLFVVMKNGVREFMGYFPAKKGQNLMMELRDEWVQSIIDNSDYLESIKENEPVPVRAFAGLRAAGKLKPLSFEKIKLGDEKFLVVEGQEFVKPSIWQFPDGFKNAPSLAIYHDYMNNIDRNKRHNFDWVLNPDWLDESGQKDLLIGRKGNRRGYDGFERSVVKSKGGGSYLPSLSYQAGDITLASFSLRFADRSKEKNGKRKINRLYVSRHWNYPLQRGKISPEEIKKIEDAAKWAQSKVEPYEKQWNDEGKIVPNRPPMPLSLWDEILDGLEQRLL